MNGWTNRSTWAVNLNLSNNEAPYNDLLKCRSAQDVQDLWLKYFDIDHDGVNMDEVSWDEILEDVITYETVGDND